MSIQVKVVPHDADPARAQAIPLPSDGVVHLDQPSRVVLDMPPDDIAAYTREGDDLIVRMKAAKCCALPTSLIQPLNQANCS
ncbi:BapA prefix-like domain-containing protein [uncultured Xanthomonas sp.]|uniref:BapA prefix-like domain-containing protein n=1 Tax=uncultured Xanthomonas sp. TaxID=152831 RepID=UPI0025E6AA48|nr:BapA prefix-like domain-containing protein [uncultured Xanthomonas sp.]